MKNQYLIYSFLFFSIFHFSIKAEDISVDVRYFKIYEFMEELANEGLIEINSSVKPYSRMFVAQKLQEVKGKTDLLSNLQKKELNFYLQEFLIEINRLEQRNIPISSFDISSASYSYLDSVFSCKISPLVGAKFYLNQQDYFARRWVGASFHSYIGKNLSLYANLRDNAILGDLVFHSSYLNLEEGAAYKAGETYKDYSEMRGGISFSTSYFSLSLLKDEVVWGNNNHGSNILSGRIPTYPLLKYSLSPVKWFEMNYMHAWLVSDVIDSTRFYIEYKGIEEGLKKYRLKNKYLAANMLTFKPVKNLHVSIGNSIVYAEDNIQPAYLLPLMMYKSIDHTLCRSVDNQNSQIFIDLSSRNIKNVHLFTSIFIDEFSYTRLKKEVKETNPVSFKIGLATTNFLIDRVSFNAEYTRNNIITYKHSIKAIDWSSSSYNLGHYLKDNSQEIYLSLKYKITRGLDMSLSYVNAKHGNDYEYLRRDIDGTNRIRPILQQDFMSDIVWTNQTYAWETNFEIFNNVYAGILLQYSDISAKEPESHQLIGENRYTEQEYLDLYTPKMFQGKNFSLGMNLNIGF